MKTIISTLTHYLFILLVLGYIIYEELVWERFAQPIIRFFTSLKLLKKLEFYLKNVNKTAILLIFISLFVFTELQGIYAGILLIQGKIILWALLYAGKIPIAAFTFWLFRITKPKLMAFPWFQTSYTFIMNGIDWIKSTDIYIDIKIKSAEIKTYIKKNYFKESGSTKEKFKRIYRHLKVRLKNF